MMSWISELMHSPRGSEKTWMCVQECKMGDQDRASVLPPSLRMMSEMVVNLLIECSSKALWEVVRLYQPGTMGHSTVLRIGSVYWCLTPANTVLLPPLAEIKHAMPCAHHFILFSILPSSILTSCVLQWCGS